MLKGLVSYESSDSEPESESDTVQNTVTTSSHTDSEQQHQQQPVKKVIKINLLNDHKIPELQITKKKFTNDSLVNRTKSGLLNLLPPVKSSTDSKLIPSSKATITKPTTKTSLMPTTILKRKNQTDLNDEIESDTIESETLTNFFSFLDSNNRNDIPAAAPSKPKIIPDLCNPAVATNSKSNAYFANLVNSSSSSSKRAEEDDKLADQSNQNESDLMENIPEAFRGSNGSVSALDIIDVNADEITKENRLLMLRNLTDETTCVGGLQDFGSTKKRLSNDGAVVKCGAGSGSGTADLGSLHRKKHQITYLAQQALENEQHLKNFWAANRHAQDQSRQKYGF